jgi:hypothetical protein
MATDPLKPNLNRGRQIKTEKEFLNRGIKLYDIDMAINDHMVETVVPTIEVMGEPTKVPVLYGNAERWASIQRDGYLRDKRGQIQIPLIVFKRNGVEPWPGMEIAVNRSLSYPAVSKYSKKHKYDLFSKMTGAQKPLEQYNITIPDYIALTYEVIVWTDFTEHMNKIVEAFQYASDVYWGDKYGFKFKTKIDSYDTTSETAEGSSRLVKTTFTINVNAYLLPEKFNNEPTTNKAFTIKKVVWNPDSDKVNPVNLPTPSTNRSTTGRTGFDYVSAYYKILDDNKYDGGGADTWPNPE